MRDLDALIKAYDIRGTVPDQLNAELAFEIGAAFAHQIGAELVAVGHDMRVSSPELADAVAAGINSRGTDSRSGWPPPICSTSRRASGMCLAR